MLWLFTRAFLPDFVWNCIFIGYFSEIAGVYSQQPLFQKGHRFALLDKTVLDGKIKTEGRLPLWQLAQKLVKQKCWPLGDQPSGQHAFMVDRYMSIAIPAKKQIALMIRFFHTRFHLPPVWILPRGNNGGPTALCNKRTFSPTRRRASLL